MKTLRWINIVLGVWLIIAGIGFSAGVGAIMAERIVLGIVIAVLAAAAASGRQHPAVSWLVAIAGLWTLVAPAFIHYGIHNVSAASDVIVGVVVLVFGFANASYEQSSRPLTHA